MDSHKKPPQQDASHAGALPALAALRTQIDALDNRIIGLLNERASLAQQVGHVKAQHALRAYAPERERQLLESLSQRNPGPLSSDSLTLIYKEIISASLALESPMEVAFLGPEGTFTHEATKRHFGLSARLHSCRTIPDVFSEVSRGRCVYGVVPVENTAEGMVIHTLDGFIESDLKICAEVLLQVSHHLLTRTGERTGVSKVYAHAQSIEQCRVWLDRHLPGVPVVDVSSTARAAQLAAEDEGGAAIASDMAASLYGLHIAASGLEDIPDHITRFLVIGRDEPGVSGNDTTSLMFALQDAPGILLKALTCFASSGLNLSRIESRPSRKKAWDYVFFVDVQGHLTDEAVSRAIHMLSEISVFLKVMGSYPQGVLQGGHSSSKQVV
jgi:chorismate mutase/prephenate dehydratase